MVDLTSRVFLGFRNDFSTDIRETKRPYLSKYLSSKKGLLELKNDKHHFRIWSSSFLDIILSMAAQPTPPVGYPPPEIRVR